jgi:hypothetical protein
MEKVYQHIGVFIDDLMTRIRVMETLKDSCDVKFLQDLDAITVFLDQFERGIVIISLEDFSIHFDFWRTRLKENNLLHGRIIAFYPHVHEKLKEKAENIGITQLYPRSIFIPKLKEIILKHKVGSKK